jgi:DNA-binding transcriptional LysR family regulator
MDTLDSMRMFARVVEAGSFTKAASLASVTTPQASRAITDLETRLHTRLLHRTTRHLSLTEAGERYLQHCEQILAQVDLAEAEAAGAGAQPSGKLRVHATTSFGQHHLAPLIARYRKRFDVSVVVARELADSALVSQRIGSMYTILCASPRYLAKHGTPVRLPDLNKHTCLQLTLPDVPLGQWHFEGKDESVFRHVRPAPLTVNVAEALAEVIRAGMGIGPLPISVALPGLRDGSLVRVLPSHRLRANNIYAMYASRRYLDAKIKTFVEFLRDQVPLALAEQDGELVALRDSLEREPYSI